MNRICLIVCLWLGAMYTLPRAAAHEVYLAYLELRQTAPDTYSVLWKMPARDDLVDGTRWNFPKESHSTWPLRSTAPGAITERFTVECPGGLDGRTVTFDGPLSALFNVVVRVVKQDGSVQTLHLSPDEHIFKIGSGSSALQTAGVYFRLGVTHILLGIDHLLFVLGLVLIVRSRWMLLKTITAFTVAHSITLAMATLGYASAPVLPLNAAIALSILFLGPEILRARRGETSFTLRHPWVVAFAFGLLHGFGFASGLADLGIPKGEIPLALVSFNLGVEGGQLFFVALILLVERAFVSLEIHWSRWTMALPAYTVGTLGAFWTIQRVWIMFAGRG